MADMDIASVRAKFPQYKDMSDDQLAQGLHQKYYSDMPYEQFSQKIGLAPSLAQRVTNAVSDTPVLGDAAAAAEIAAQSATGLAGKAVGGVGGLLTAAGKGLGLTDANPADVVEKTQNAMTYQPRTPKAQAVEKEIGSIVQPVAGEIDKQLGTAGHFVGGDTGENIARTVLPAVADAALTLAPGARALKGAGALAEAAPAAVEGAAKPVVGTGMDAIATGRAAGFKFSPGAVESRNPGVKVPDTLTGASIDDRRSINLHNQARATELVGEHLGVPNAKTLPKNAFEDAKKPHLDTYTDTGEAVGSGKISQETGQAVGIKISPETISALEDHLADTSPGQLKGDAKSQTKRILAAATSGNSSGPQMVKDISFLRQNGGKGVANTLEKELEQQLAATPAGAQQLEKFQQARTGLAQINDLQRATTGGQISVPKLVALDEKNPNMLTGPAKLLAQTGAAAPQDFKLPSGIQPGSSPLSEGILQKIPLIGSGTHAALAVGEKVLKWGAKKLAPGKLDATSDAFQNKFGRVASPDEATYFKDFGKRPAAPSKAFELQPSPGSTGVNPTQLGMQLAQGRPLSDQKLTLAPTDGTIEPHQPSLLGHEGTPEGGSRGKKAKKRGKD